MTNFSVTITGLLMVVLSNFVPAEEVETVLEAIGIIIAWYGRFRAGGINWLGVK